MINVFQIESVGKCNATCSYCPRGVGQLGPDSNHFLSARVLEKALALIKDAGSQAHVYMHHRGEPFLHPNLPELVLTIRKAGLYARLSTNLISVTEKKARAVLENGLNEITLHYTAGLTNAKLTDDDLLQRIHMIRKLNFETRNNACRLEFAYALTDATEDEVMERLQQSRWFDEAFHVAFFQPHDWPRLGLMEDRGIDTEWCSWTIHRGCSILANGDLVICCLDQWGHSKKVNIMDIEHLTWDLLDKRDLCKACVQYTDHDEWIPDALGTPEWLQHRLSYDPFDMQARKVLSLTEVK